MDAAFDNFLGPGLDGILGYLTGYLGRDNHAVQDVAATMAPVAGLTVWVMNCERSCASGLAA